uniref:Uncharacterized protein n=1 Tax=Bionectria ochroleuca TaxID=29856 RepID=A0A8H7NG86_BIOOC
MISSGAPSSLSRIRIKTQDYNVVTWNYNKILVFPQPSSLLAPNSLENLPLAPSVTLASSPATFPGHAERHGTSIPCWLGYLNTLGWNLQHQLRPSPSSMGRVI